MPKTAAPQTISSNSPSKSEAASRSPVQSASPAAAHGFSWGRALRTTLFRLLLLGVGGTITAVVGIAVAQLYPDQTQQLPLVSELGQQAEAKLTEMLSQVEAQVSAHLPSQLAEPLAQWLPTSPQPAVPAPATLITPASPDTSQVASSLTEAERQQMQAELTALQAELQTLTSRSTQPLASRVEELQKRIQSIQAKLNAFTAADLQPFVAAATVSSTSGSNGSESAEQPLLVTLPSDALFETSQVEAGQVKLGTGKTAILDSIVADLKRYPNASIQVAAYTDPRQSAEMDRQKTLEQARAVQNYLARQMETSVHWVTLGQGHNRPLAANDSATNRQRNRRVEISILPR